MKPYIPEKEDYESVADSDDDTLLGQDPIFQRPTKKVIPSQLLWFASGLIIAVVMCALAFSILVDQKKGGVCAKYTSQWSPIVEDVDINYSLVKYDGRFRTENIYRQAASPEVDEAWSALGGTLRPFIVKEADAAKAGLTHSHARVNKKYGGGYPVNFEALHHIHCLNLLRQSTWFNYDYYHAKGEGPFSNDDKILRWHVTHCYDTLRQQLMCTADTGVLGRIWYNNHTDPENFIDFNTQHKCKNYNAIVDWAKDHQILQDPYETPDDYLEPPADEDFVYPTLP